MLLKILLFLYQIFVSQIYYLIFMLTLKKLSFDLYLKIVNRSMYVYILLYFIILFSITKYFYLILQYSMLYVKKLLSCRARIKYEIYL